MTKNKKEQNLKGLHFREGLGCFWKVFLETSKSSTRSGKEESKDEDVILLARHNSRISEDRNTVKLKETRPPAENADDLLCRLRARGEMSETAQTSRAGKRPLCRFGVVLPRRGRFRCRIHGLGSLGWIRMRQARRLVAPNSQVGGKHIVYV